MIAVLALGIACTAIGVSLYAVAFARRRAIASAGRRRCYVVVMPDGRYLTRWGLGDDPAQAERFDKHSIALYAAEVYGATVIDA